MSLKREELIWLLKECGEMSPPEPPSPCDNVDTIQADDTITTVTGKPDHEVEMAHKQLHRTAKQSQSLADRLGEMEEANLPAWVQAKITMASEYISKVHGYLDDLLSGAAEESTEIVVMKENYKKNTHDIEIDLDIVEEDVKNLQNGGEIILKEATASNNFTVRIKSS